MHEAAPTHGVMRFSLCILLALCCVAHGVDLETSRTFRTHLKAHKKPLLFRLAAHCSMPFAVFTVIIHRSETGRSSSSECRHSSGHWNADPYGPCRCRWCGFWRADHSPKVPVPSSRAHLPGWLRSVHGVPTMRFCYHSPQRAQSSYCYRGSQCSAQGLRVVRSQHLAPRHLECYLGPHACPGDRTPPGRSHR